MTWPTAKLALAGALPLELANYFVVGYPAGIHLSVPGNWFVKVAAQWYLLHLPGIFALNRFDTLRNYRTVGSVILFLSGWADTALFLALGIWAILLVFRIARMLRPASQN